MAPARALAEFAAGRMAMLPPTEAVAAPPGRDSRTAAEVLADAASRDRSCRCCPAASSTRRRGAVGLVNDRTGEVLVDAVRMPHTARPTGCP